MKSWIYLSLAGLLEVVWALALKASEGFSHFAYSILTLITMALSFSLLSLALKGLPVGTAYAVWTGIGALGTAIFGILFFGESASLARMVSIFLILCGVLGLKWLS